MGVIATAQLPRTLHSVSGTLPYLTGVSLYLLLVFSKGTIPNNYTVIILGVIYGIYLWEHHFGVPVYFMHI